MAELNAVAAHNVIIDAISSDLATIDDFTFSGITLKDFETHDCLGSTFYFYAYLKSGYTSLRFHLPPATILAWIQERLRTGNITPYIDKELAAIGLGIYALCKFHKDCPNVREEFASLVEPHFDSNRGLYGNFLASVLVYLGLKVIGSDATVLDGLEQYVRDQLKHHANVVFNDPKNLVVAHMWAKEVAADEVLKALLNESLERLVREETLDRDRVYYSYVLFEEIRSIPRRDRHLVKQSIENSLAYLYDYSIESVFSPAIVDAYSYDVVTSTTGMQEYGYTARPRLSRILLSVGLMIDRKYNLEGGQLLSNRAQILRFFRGILVPALFLFVLALFIYFTRQIGLPLPIANDLASGEFGRILLAICAKVPLDMLWMSVVIVLFCWFAGTLYYILITAQTDDELVATTLTYHFVKKHWRVEIVIALIGGIAASLALGM